MKQATDQFGRGGIDAILSLEASPAQKLTKLTALFFDNGSSEAKAASICAADGMMPASAIAREGQAMNDEGNDPTWGGLVLLAMLGSYFAFLAWGVAKLWGAP
jgi:hypothetical protein